MSVPSSPLLNRLPYKSRVLSGLLTANDVTDVVNDIVIQPGFACDDNGVVYFLPALIRKRLDASWVQGSAPAGSTTLGGGLVTGSKAADTIYGIWLIANSSDVLDVMFAADVSPALPIPPAGWRIITRLAWIITNSSSAIWLYVQTGDYTEIRQGITTSGSVPTAYLNNSWSLFAPYGTIAKVSLSAVGTATFYTSIGSTTEVWTVPSATASPGITVTTAAVGSYAAGETLVPMTSPKACRMASTGGNVTIYTTVRGWFDNRGKDI